MYTIFDILSSLLSLEKYPAFGKPVQSQKLAQAHIKFLEINIFLSNSEGFFPAASFMSFQHCVFNFGREPFQYPPKEYSFQNFNSYGHLNENEKIVLPK